MSRPLWKPEYIHPSYIEQRKNKADKFVFYNKAILIIEEMIAQSFVVYNGKEWFTLEIEADMVGHLVGEFAPTRKRSTVKKRK